jgi:hypothetical protein
MPKAHYFYPSKYLNSEDAPQPIEVTVRHVSEETVGEQRKPVCYFEDLSKGLVLNKTNFMMLAQIAKNDDSDNWGGVRVVLTVELVSYKGTVTRGLRLHPIGRKKVSKKVDVEQELDDELPGFEEEAA